MGWEGGAKKESTRDRNVQWNLTPKMRITLTSPP